MRVWHLSTCAALLLCPAQAVPASAQGALLVLLNGKIVSMDDRTNAPKPGHIYQAMAIEEDKIVALGTDDEIKKLIRPGARVVRLGGRTVLPGLIDSHTHPESFGPFYRPNTGRGVFQPHNLIQVDYRLPIETIRKQMIDILQEVGKTMPKGEWVHIMLGGPRFGTGGVDNKVFVTDQALIESGVISKEMLDRYARDNPVLVGTNSSVLNTKAIEVLRKEWPANLTAKMEERRWAFKVPESFYYLPWDYFGKKAGLDKMIEVVRQELEMLPEVGVTTYSSRSSSEVPLQVYQHMRDTGQLPIRVGMANEMIRRYPDAEKMKIARSMTPLTGRPTDDWFWVAGLAYEEEWADEPAFSAMAEAIRRGSRPAHVHLHKEDARGWRFIELLEKAGLTPEQSRKLRPLTLHFTDIFDRKLFTELAKWGVYQTAYGATGLGFALEKGKHSPGVPVKSALDAGVHMVWESDQINTVGSNTGKPFNAVQVYVTRKWDNPDPLGGGTLDADQAVDRVVALKMMTTWSSEAMFMENKIGTLEVGKLADFIVLNKDVLTVPAEQIHTVAPILTVIGGNTAYSAGIIR